MSRIKLSPRYGVNPTIPVCFFCGETKNQIALLGRIRDTRKHKTAFGTYHTEVVNSDMEAPRCCVLDYEPCDKCREKFSQGVLLIGATTMQPDDGRPPLTAKGGVEVYPTGSYAVMKEEAATNLFNMPLHDGDKLFVEHPIIEHITKAAESAT